MTVSDPKWSMDADGARISFRAQSIADAKAMCEKLEPGKDYDLTAKAKRKSRSLSSNSLMWAVLGEMAVELRKTDPKVIPDDLYQNYIRESANYAVIEIWDDMADDFIRAWEARGLGWIAEKTAVAEMCDGMNKWTIRCWKGSSAYDTAEMDHLIDSILQDAGALGICSDSTKALLEAYPDGQ